MNQNILSLILLIFCILILTIYLLIRNKQLNIYHVFDEATDKSQYKPTEFLIYDYSTDKICNRLIIIKPFDWFIWGYNGDIYILNPENGKTACTENNTPVIQIYRDRFHDTCITMKYDSILNFFTKSSIGSGDDKTIVKKTVIPYEISKDTKIFTILSALNILLKDWLYLKEESSRNTRITNYDEINDKNSNNEKKIKKRSTFPISTPTNTTTTTNETTTTKLNSNLLTKIIESQIKNKNKNLDSLLFNSENFKKPQIINNEK